MSLTSQTQARIPPAIFLFRLRDQPHPGRDASAGKQRGKRPLAAYSDGHPNKTKTIRTAVVSRHRTPAADDRQEF